MGVGVGVGVGVGDGVGVGVGVGAGLGVGAAVGVTATTEPELDPLDPPPPHAATMRLPPAIVSQLRILNPLDKPKPKPT